MCTYFILYQTESIKRRKNLAACGGTFLTRLTRLTRPPRLSESDGGQARFFYILYIQNIPSILSKKGNSYTIKLRCGELDRNIALNKRKDMKRISQHFGGPSNFSMYRKERYMESVVRLVRSDYYLVLWSKKLFNLKDGLPLLACQYLFS